MKIQKDIHSNFSHTQKSVDTTPPDVIITPNYDKAPFVESINEPEEDVQSRVDSIFEEADAQIEQATYKALGNTNSRLSRWKSRIGWGIIGFVLFTVIGLSVIGYKTYQYVENRLPGIKEAIVYRYEEMQNEFLQINDDDLTDEAYYKKQYMLILSPTDVRDIVELGLSVEKMQQLKDMVENNETVGLNLFELLPEEKAIEFIRVMLAEKQSKELGERVDIQSITDEEVQQFLMTLQEQQKLTED